MKIAIDGHYCSLAFGGLGVFSIGIVQALDKLGLDELVVLIPFTPEGSYSDLHLSGRSKCEMVEVKAPLEAIRYSTGFSLQWEQYLIPPILESLQPDLFFGPVYMCPQSWDGPRIVTVHDLAFEAFPHFYPDFNREYFSRWGRECANSADAIVTPSRQTAADIERYWSIKNRPIVNVGASTGFEIESTTKQSPGSNYDIVRELGIRDPYILHVGGGHPRKNVESLIEAYSALGELRSDYQLVLINVNIDRIQIALEHFDIANRVVCTGFLPQAVLRDVYTHASIFVYPSISEGFGIPVLEAMRFGIPVVTSRVGSIEEVAQSAAVYIDPLSVESISSGMRRVLKDRALRENLSILGKTTSKEFTWINTALKTRGVMGYVLDH